MARATERSGTVLQVRRVIQAPREVVFRAWTDPAELKRWFGSAAGGQTIDAEMDVRPGQTYRLAMRGLGSNLARRLPGSSDGIAYMVGTYLEVEEPERLVFTMGWEGVPFVRLSDSRVTVEFRDEGGATEIVLTHERLRHRGLRELHLFGWKSNLSSLERWLAAGEEAS